MSIHGSTPFFLSRDSPEFVLLLAGRVPIHVNEITINFKKMYSKYSVVGWGGGGGVTVSSPTLNMSIRGKFSVESLVYSFVITQLLLKEPEFNASKLKK